MVIIGQRRLSPLSYMELSSGANASSGGLGNPVRSLRLNLQRVNGGGYNSPNVEVERGTLARIFENDLDEGIRIEFDQLHVFGEDIRTQLTDNRISGLLRYFSGGFADFNGPPQKPGLYADSDELKKRNDDCSDAKPYRVSIEMIFGRTVLGLLLGLGLSIVGWENLYNSRRLRGTALIGSGWLCGALSLLSIWWPL